VTVNPYDLLHAWYPTGGWGDRFKPAESLARDARLNLQEAAEYLGFTPRKLKDLCREKRITHSRPDYRTYRFKRADLDEWLEQYRMQRRSVHA